MTELTGNIRWGPKVSEPSNQILDAAGLLWSCTLDRTCSGDGGASEEAPEGSYMRWLQSAQVTLIWKTQNFSIRISNGPR